MKQDNNKRNFDFTSVPKELIYFERQHLDDFDVENRASLNYFIYEELYDRFSHFTDFEEFAKAMFNYSYYVCTVAIVDDHAERRFGTFRKDIFTAFRYDKTYSGIVLAMVLLQIRIQRWDISPNIIRLADSIEKELKSKEYGELFSEFYLRIRERMGKISPKDLERAPFEEFLPRKINRKVLMDTCSYWDWCHEFGTNEEKMLEFIQAIGKNEDEQMVISQFLREQTHQAFTNGGEHVFCFDYIDRQIYLHYHGDEEKAQLEAEIDADMEEQILRDIEADYNKQRVGELEAEIAKLRAELEASKNGNCGDEIPANIHENLQDDKTEMIIELLKPIFYDSEESVKEFLDLINDKTDIHITDTVFQWVKSRKIVERSKGRPLWQVLHAAKIYRATEQNWNTALRNHF